MRIREYVGIALVWLLALMAANVALVVVPPGIDVPGYASIAAAKGEAGLIGFGASIVLQGMVMTTAAGLVLGLGIESGLPKHVAVLVLATAAMSVVYGWLLSPSMLALAQTVATAYGCLVGALAGHALRRAAFHRNSGLA